MHDQPLDLLIIGAGVSGIAMACALKRQCPDKRFAIVDRRPRVGGTWDLFRYPGARSDSDMLGYAFSFRPWRSPRLLAPAGEIRDYLQATARDAGIEPAIHHGLRVRAARWSSAEQCWTVMAEGDDDGLRRHFRARFLVMGTGYYDHDAGHAPRWPGQDAFEGALVHPQHWPESLDVRGRRVVVIGSGATAVSLVPALADAGAEVTLLQRSPGYLLSAPATDRLSPLIGQVLARKLNIAFAAGLYRAARRWPEAVRRLLLRHVQSLLPAGADLGNFSPRYAPWDQRLCIVADGDLFRTVREGRVRVVTGEIDRFEPSGPRLRSGQRLDADVVVSATGLRLQALGGIEVAVDGQCWHARDHMLYRGVLPEGLPNAAWILGYINAAWTLKAELAASYVCRLLQHLDERGLGHATPVDRRGCRTDAGIMAALAAGYVQRGDDQLPRQGRSAPWRVAHDLRQDRRQLLHEPIDDGVLQFGGRAARRSPPAAHRPHAATPRRALRGRPLRPPCGTRG